MSKKIVAEESLRGTDVIFPELGKVTIPEDGVIEFEDETIAESLVHSKQYSIFEIDTKKELVVDKGDEDKVTLENLQSLTLNEMISLAEESKLPKKDWEKFANNTVKPVELMANYLFKKLNQ